jgi:hypothetical protein
MGGDHGRNGVPKNPDPGATKTTTISKPKFGLIGVQQSVVFGSNGRYHYI